VKTPRGQIKRISAAILVDYDLQWKGSGSKSEMVLVPPPNEKLQVIRQISSSILGLQENRGDQITVDSLAFDYTLSLMKQSHVATQGSGTSNQGDWLKSLWNGGRPTKETIVQGGALIVLFLVCLVSIILWRKRDRTRIRAGVETARALPAGAVDIGETAFIQGGLPSDRPRVAGSAQPAPQMTDRIREDVRRDPRLAASVVRRMISDAG
jgi:flagellar biosynthesis/type III secretory pathway M-ring protein FliF/YscJ